MLVWFFTILLSMLPIAIMATMEFLQTGELGEPFLFDLFIGQDTLWIFATLLIVSLFDAIAVGIDKEISVFKVVLLFLSILLVLSVEAYWIMCKYASLPLSSWIYVIGIALCVLSVLCSLPIQISHIKSRDVK